MEIVEVNFKSQKKKTNICHSQAQINKRYLEEAKFLEARWQQHGILDGIKDKWHRQTIAVLLENQRLMNEQPNGLNAQFTPY